MKKHAVGAMMLALALSSASAQDNAASYPQPEFMQEIYAYNKDAHTLVRLEKEFSKLETKVKAAGFGGSEMAYNLNGEKSKVRFSSAQLPSFVYCLHQDFSDKTERDSAHVQSGMRSMSAMMDDVIDPSRNITLYALDPRGGGRSLIVASSGGTFSKGKKSSNKYSLSVKKIKDGYFEFVVEKPLPRGEYGFMNVASGTGETTLFLFGVD